MMLCRCVSDKDMVMYGGERRYEGVVGYLARDGLVCHWDVVAMYGLWCVGIGCVSQLVC